MLTRGFINLRMSVQITNIVRGIGGVFTRKKKQGRFGRLGWLREKILKHEEDKRLKTLELNGLKVSYRRPYELMHTYKELFEEEIYHFKANNSIPFIIDCGANIGLSVLYFKKLYPEATVLAFEPDEDNYMLLQKNTAQNGLQNVECRKHAVWVHNGVINFASDGTQGSGIAREEATKNIVQVKTERLADILQTRNVDFLKIDIEGAELDVLKDCEPYLHNVQCLFVEYHGKAEETAKLTQLLEVLSTKYKVYIKLAADNLAYPFVTKATGGAFDVQLNLFCYL
jgi:FkbM family methyltransferase